MTNTETAGAVADVPAIAETPAAVESEANEAQPKESGDVNQPADPVAEELKKLRNYYSKSKGQIARERAQRQQLQREVEELRQSRQENKPEAAKPPSERDFADKTYEELLDAKAKYYASQAYQESQKKAEESRTQAQQLAWEAERAAKLDEGAAKAVETFPDFDNVMQENADVMADLSPTVRRAVLEADNGALALYHLAKEGTLEQLNGMSAYKVAATLARAEDKALSYQKPVTKTPAPLSPNRGTAAASKSLSAMSFEEIKKELKLK